MGQLVQRYVCRGKFTCMLLATVLWVGAVANLYVTFFKPQCGDPYWYAQTADAASDKVVPPTDEEYAKALEEWRACEDAYYSSSNFAVASVLSTIFASGMCVFTMLVRSFVRDRDRIPATLCAGLDDCVCALCCLPCVQCQLMRHEGMTGGRYKLVSSDGSSEGLYQV